MVLPKLEKQYNDYYYHYHNNNNRKRKLLTMMNSDHEKKHFVFVIAYWLVQLRNKQKHFKWVKKG